MSYTPAIFTPNQLYEKAKSMQSFLEEKPSDQDEGLITRLEHLQILSAQSGKMLADAKYWLDTKKNDAITQTLKDALIEEWKSRSTINKKIDALCREENYLVALFDRINSSATHQMDSLRTVISYRKEQMRMV
jgi:hypothetical protein